MITNVNADCIKQWSGLYFGRDGDYVSLLMFVCLSTRSQKPMQLG